MGVFGGGGGDDGAGSAISAVNEGKTGALAALDKYYPIAQQYLQQGQQTAQAQLAPYGMLGANAADMYADTLGVARPQASSFQLQQALMAQNAAASQQQPTQTAQTSQSSQPSNGLSPDERIGGFHFVTEGNADTGQATKLIADIKKGVKDPISGEFTPGGPILRSVDASTLGYKAQAGVSRWDPNPAVYYDPSLIQAPTAASAPTTPTQQPTTAQQSLADQYKAGTLAMQTTPYQTVLDRFNNAPGYQFLLQQSQQALDRSAAAKGLSGSGAIMKGAQEYAQGLASQQFNNYQSQLAGLAGMGANASTTMAGINANTGGSQSSLAQAQGGNIANVNTGTATNLANIQMAQAAANAQSGSSMFGALGSIAGYAMGGPIGSAIGGQITQHF